MTLGAAVVGELDGCGGSSFRSGAIGTLSSALKDGDFCMNESRAIMCYLANAYGDEKLFPKDLKLVSICVLALSYTLLFFTKTSSEY